jgi:hypothetical protein
MIDLSDDELTALTTLILRILREDGFPHAPRLIPLRSALAKLVEASRESAASGQKRPAPKEPKSPKARPRGS